MLDDTGLIRAEAQVHPLIATPKSVRAFEGQSISDIVREARLDPSFGLPVVHVWHHDRATLIPMSEWARVRPKRGVTVFIGYSTAGPAIATIATAALSAAAPSIATILGFSAGTFAFALVTAGITVVGALAINALIGPPRPSGRQDDPNYAITGVGNVEAKYRPVPLVCGRHRMFPTKSATGYSETVDGEIYWRGRYCFGWGRVGLEDIRIGNTPITEFDDVEIEFLNVDKDFTLANTPGLDALTAPKASEELDPEEVLREPGDAWTFTPASTARDVEIRLRMRTAIPGGTFDVVIDGRLIGGGWTQLQSYSGVSGDVDWTSPSYTDGQARDFRVRLLAINEPDDSEIGLIARRVRLPGVKIRKAKAEYQAGAAIPAWRYGAERMNLYPSDVQEEQLNVLLEKDDPVVRLTTNDAASAAIDISYPAGLFDSDDGSTQRHEVNYAFRYQRVGETTWTDAGTARHEADTQTLIRFTKTIQFASPGEHRIEVTRTDSIDNDAGDQNRGFLTAIRSFANARIPSYARISEVALRIKATDQLNGQVDSLNCIVQQFAPKWTGTGWGPNEPVRHPAWIFADLLRGPHLDRPVSDDRIDRNALKAWADEEPDWTFDYVFDNESTVAAALQLVAAAGRAKAHLADLRYSVIRDGAAGPVRQVFTPRNSWGFKGTIAFSREVHGFRVRVRSERLEWEQDEFTVYLDGFSEANATEFEVLELPGVILTENETDQGNAFRLARYHLANVILRPETYEWHADFEHLAVTRGDKVQLVHDVPKIGVGQGRIKSIETSSGNLDALTLDDIQPGAGGDDFRLTVRRRDGTLLQFSANNLNTLDGRWVATETVSASGIGVGDLVAIEAMSQESFEVLVTGIFAGEDLSARLTGVPAAPEVLTADTEAIPAYAPVITELPDRYGPPQPVVLRVFSDRTSAQRGRDDVLRVRAGVEIAPYEGGRGVRLRLRWSDPLRGGWREGRAEIPESTLYTGDLPEGLDVAVEIAAEDANGNRRGWVRAGTVTASSGAPPPAPTVGAVVVSGIRDVFLSWTPDNVADVKGWNVYGALTEFGTYTFIRFVKDPSAQIRPPAGVRWYRYAAVSFNGTEGPLGPAVEVVPVGVTVSDLVQELRDQIDAAIAIGSEALEDIESGPLAELRDLAITPGYDRSRPLSERISALTLETDDAFESVVGAQAEEIVGDLEARVASEEREAEARGGVYARINEDAAASAGRFEILRAEALANAAAIVREQQVRADAISAEAQAREAITASVGENAAAILSEATARATADGALSTRIDQVEATASGNAASITTLQGAKVDAAGAVAAVTQTISAEYGDLEALAEATAFAEAAVDGIAAGYVWRVNGQNLLELVSVQYGTDGPVSTFKIAADYVQITGIAQIQTAVIDQLFANSIVAGRLEVTDELVVSGRSLLKPLLSRDNTQRSFSSQQTICTRVIPADTQDCAVVGCSFYVFASAAGRTFNWKLFADLNSGAIPATRRDIVIASGNGTAPVINTPGIDPPLYVNGVGYDGRPFNGADVTLTLVVEPTNGQIFTDDASIQVLQDGG